MNYISRLSQVCTMFMALLVTHNVAFAQDEPEPQLTVTPNPNLPDFVTMIDGSKTPELIPDNLVYGSFARNQVSSNSPNCLPVADRPAQSAPSFSTITTCSRPLNGLDMDKVVQLAKEYQLRSSNNVAEIPVDMCVTRKTELSNMSISAFAAYMEDSQAAIVADEAAFFVKRAHELFSDQEYETLMKYIDRVKGRTHQSVIDQEKMLKTTGLTPAFIIQQMCSHYPNPPQ